MRCNDRTRFFTTFCIVTPTMYCYTSTNLFSNQWNSKAGRRLDIHFANSIVARVFPLISMSRGFA